MRSFALLLAVAVSGAACGGGSKPATTGGNENDAAVATDAITPDDAAPPNVDVAADMTPDVTPDVPWMSTVDAGVGGDAPDLTPVVTIHMAGDSTAAIFPSTDATGRVGWAAVVQQFFTDGLKMNDAAKSGRSSKSFIDEGFWTSTKAMIQPGDYVFIQFAHNDEKVEDPLRYTNPQTTFHDYLKTYIADARAAGAFAVLMTPICRRQFSGTKITQTHGLYPAAILEVAAETGTPVIDMMEKTRVWLEGLGPTASIPMFATSDNTHLSAMGAPEVAKLAVAGIREAGFPIGERLLP